jgi:hypothetical protein
MITAIVKKVSERRGPNDPYGVIEKYEMDFETIGEIEHYLAYNRAYIKSIQFKGKIEITENN